MTPKLTEAIFGVDRSSATSSDTSRSEADVDSGNRLRDRPSEWHVVPVGDEPNIHELDSDEKQGVRVLVPHLDAAILVQPVLVDEVFKEQAWRVALQEKIKLWETGSQFAYDTRWEVWAENRREVDAILEALTTDLAAAADVSGFRVIGGPDDVGDRSTRQ